MRGLRSNHSSARARGADCALRLRTFVATLVLIASAGSWTPAVSAQPTAPAGASDNRIEVDAANLRNSNGSFRCELFNSPNGFPRDDKARLAGQAVRIEAGHATCVFKDLPPGDYAAVVMHDEYGDGKMRYNFIGIPTEGYGFSNDPRVLLSPPSFDAAKVQYSGGVLRVAIHLKY